MARRYSTDLQVRFRDVDPLYHVSHTVYVVYMQQARLAFSEDVLGMTDSAYDTVVAHLEVDYEDEVGFGDAVTVETWVTDVGTTSFTMAYAIRGDGTRAASAESVQVVVDAEDGESTAVPPEWREHLEDYHVSEQAGDGEDGTG